MLCSRRAGRIAGHLTALAAICGPASAQLDSTIDVGPHSFHRRQLKNGLRAIAVRDDGAKLSVFMVIGAGKRNETPETTGLAHLTEHAMYAGTKRTRLGEHDRRIRAMGAESNAYTREDFTLFYDHLFPADKLDEVLSMEADRLRGLTFDEKSVLYERERLRIEEEHTFSPTDGRQQQLESRVYRVHPYAAGVVDENGHTMAPTLSVAAVRAFYDRYYHPDNTAVVVVGGIDQADALDAIERAFGELPRGPRRVAPPAEPDVDAPRREEIQTELPRDRCNFAWIVPAMGDADRPALQVLARYLSRQTAADGSPIEARVGTRVDRELFVVAATGDGAAEQLEPLMQRVREQPLPDDELNEIKSLLADDFSSLPLRARPYFSLAGVFASYEVLGHAGVLAGYRAAVDALDADTVLVTARRHLDPKRQVTVLFKASPGAAFAPLPNDRKALQTAAEEAKEAGDLDRAIAAYTKLLGMGPSKMFRVIYLASRGEIKVQQKDYDGAIADYEAALAVVDYPAVRDLLREAEELRDGAGQRQPPPGTTSKPTSRKSPHK